jgi:hypothetical protein
MLKILGTFTFFVCALICSATFAANSENPKPVTVENQPIVDIGNTVGVDVLTMPVAPSPGIDLSDSPRVVEVQAICSVGPADTCIEEVALVTGKIISATLLLRASAAATDTPAGECGMFVSLDSGTRDNAIKLAGLNTRADTKDDENLNVQLAVPIAVENDDLLGMTIISPGGAGNLSCLGNVRVIVLAE